jgi:hypothetical protein
MAKDILGYYGRDSRQPQAPTAKSGGVKEAKPMPYSKPQGPTNQMHSGPGPGYSATNHGCGTQGKR